MLGGPGNDTIPITDTEVDLHTRTFKVRISESVWIVNHVTSGDTGTLAYNNVWKNVHTSHHH